jgi:1-acyl-sn-glycerol-3-phosphate acyltransferase
MNAEQEKFYKGMQKTFKPLMDLIIKAEVEGHDNIPESGGCILASNHRSDLDPVVLSFQIERPITWIAGKYLYNIPVVKDFLEGIGAIPVSKDKESIELALDDAGKVLKEGGVIGIFPEGWASIGEAEARVGKFQTGFARLALKYKVPVVPIAIIGEDEKVEEMFIPEWLRTVWKYPEHLEKAKRVVFKRARIRIGEPLHFYKQGKKITYKRLQDISEETRKTVENLMN